jgi:hypothetical protein
VFFIRAAMWVDLPPGAAAMLNVGVRSQCMSHVQFVQESRTPTLSRAPEALTPSYKVSLSHSIRTWKLRTTGKKDDAACKDVRSQCMPHTQFVERRLA